MFRPRLTRTAIALLAGVMIGGLTTGVTYAATDAASAGVKACANKAGDLALLSKGKCRRGYRATTISKTGATGRTGPRGRTGATGQAGQTGPAGPSNGYSLSIHNPKFDGTETLALPAGSYLVTWDYQDEQIVNNGPATGSYSYYAACLLYNKAPTRPVALGTTVTDIGALVPTNKGYYRHVGQPTQTLSVNLATAGLLTLDCVPTEIVDGNDTPPPANITAGGYNKIDITAIKVGTLHSN